MKWKHNLKTIFGSIYTKNSEKDTQLDENAKNKLIMQSIYKVSGNEPGYFSIIFTGSGEVKQKT